MYIQNVTKFLHSFYSVSSPGLNGVSRLPASLSRVNINTNSQAKRQLKIKILLQYDRRIRLHLQDVQSKQGSWCMKDIL